MGKRVYVSAVNTPPEMAVFIDRGVNGILADVPALLSRVIGELNEYTLLERLLLGYNHETAWTFEEAEQR